MIKSIVGSALVKDMGECFNHLDSDTRKIR